jgi:hypothetical protein
LEQSFLVGGRTPAAVAEELDPIVRGIGCGFAQGAEEIGVEVGYTRNPVVQDRRAVGEGAIGIAKRTTVLTGKSGRTKVLTAKTAVLTSKGVLG